MKNIGRERERERDMWTERSGRERYEKEESKKGERESMYGM